MRLRGVSAAAILAAFALTFYPGAPVDAQAPQQGRLFVTVVDQSGGALPRAIVTVTGTDDATKRQSFSPVEASDQGVATLTSLAPGRYSVQAEFPGFETRVVPDVRVRAGDNRQIVTLPIQRLQDSITVGVDAQRAAADPRGSKTTVEVSQTQIDALSDDPTEAAQQLADLAGPNAIIRVDSFEGAQLPPKSQIRSVHITRDAFAAENHNPNAFFVDIITQPGVGPLKGNFNYRSRPGALSGRSPFVTTKGPEHTDEVIGNLNGSLLKERASFSVFLNARSAYETPVLNVALADGTRSETLTVRAPTELRGANILFDYALTGNQTLRLGYGRFQFDAENQGIGGFNLPDRGYSSESNNQQFFVQETGPIGRRLFVNTRASVGRLHFAPRSNVETPTIIVTDAFTAGGQQTAGDRFGTVINVNSDLDYIRGIHSIRTGTQLGLNVWDSTISNNYLGTYTFDSLAAYEAGQPLSYTRRIGNPKVSYEGFFRAVYLQDDVKVSKSLTFSPGLRYEGMTYAHNLSNWGPRFGVTWAPFASGRTTLRATEGVFYDWLGVPTVEQVAQVDGVHQVDVNIPNPAYPNPGPISAGLPADRYFFDPNLKLPRNLRFSAGADQTLSPRARLNVGYSYVAGSHLFRGLNENAPVNGVRPDPRFANVIDIIGDASSRQHQLTTTMTVNLSDRPAPPPGGAVTGPRLDWKRTTFTGTYTLTHLRNNTDGQTIVPAEPLSQEWGPADNDGQRAFLSVNSQALRNLSVLVSLTVSSGPVYSIRSGVDTNGDLIFNDRPAGVGRNTERMPLQAWINTNVVYSIPLGMRRATSTPYRFQVGVNAQNLTNRANYIGYSGLLLSPFFGQPTSVLNPRKVDLTVGLTF